MLRTNNPRSHVKRSGLRGAFTISRRCVFCSLRPPQVQLHGAPMRFGHSSRVPTTSDGTCTSRKNKQRANDFSSRVPLLLNGALTEEPFPRDVAGSTQPFSCYHASGVSFLPPLETGAHKLGKYSVHKAKVIPFWSDRCFIFKNCSPTRAIYSRASTAFKSNAIRATASLHETFGPPPGAARSMQCINVFLAPLPTEMKPLRGLYKSLVFEARGETRCFSTATTRDDDRTRQQPQP